MKRTLILLHGALGSWGGFHELINRIEDKFRIHVIDFDGHGYAPNPKLPFRIDRFAENLYEYLEMRNLMNANIFGYSMGGYVALYMAHFYPERIRKIMTLGTKFDWNPEFSKKEAGRLDYAILKEKAPQFVENLDLSTLNTSAEELITRTSEMMLHLGENAPINEEFLSEVPTKVRLLRGSEDRMVTKEETEQVASWLSAGEAVELAGQPHPLEKVDMDVLAAELKKWY